MRACTVISHDRGAQNAAGDGQAERTMITRSAFILALAATAFGPTSAAAQDITLKFSHFLGPKSFFQLDVVEPWARELEARTNGRVKVETFDGTSAVGGVTDQASNVQAGKVRSEERRVGKECRARWSP